MQTKQVIAIGVISYLGAFLWQLIRPFSVVTWLPAWSAMAEDRALLTEQLAALKPAPGQGPDIVLIVLDTVRADRLGVYGHDQETSPALDAWAADGRVFERVAANGAWTLPSHASLFTGLPVRSHGARGTQLSTGFPASGLAPNYQTIAETLSAAGYRTLGLAANRAFLQPSWGLNQGFDLYLCDDLASDGRGLGYTSGDRITELALQMLEDRPEGPTFLFLNYMDAHTPWIPRLGYVRDAHQIDPRLLPFRQGFTASSTWMMATGEMDERAVRSWEIAYDAELRFLDAQLGRLLARLPELGIDEDDYVFITSDHGEFLGEHGLVEHSKDVYEPVLHVPLIVQGPGYGAGQDETPLQLHDIAAMILDAAGLPPPAGYVPTGDMQVSELYYTRWKDLSNPVYGNKFDRIRRAFRDGDYKLIMGSDGSHEAYNLSGDPGEERPLDDAPWLPELESRANAWVDARPQAPTWFPVEGKTDLRALQALGYIDR